MLLLLQHHTTEFITCTVQLRKMDVHSGAALVEEVTPRSVSAIFKYTAQGAVFDVCTAYEQLQSRTAGAVLQDLQ